MEREYMKRAIENEAKMLQNAKKAWIEEMKKSGGDPKVIEFIADIRYHGAL